MKLKISELRQIITETVQEAAGAAALRDYIDAGPEGRLFHVSGGKVRVGDGYADDAEVPSSVESVLRRLIDLNRRLGVGGILVKELSARWDEYMAGLEAGRPVEDATVFGQGGRRLRPGMGSPHRREPKITRLGPGDPATWGGRRLR